MDPSSTLIKFRTYLKRKSLSNNTVTSYTSDISNFLEEIEIKDIKELDAEVCTDYISVLLDTNAASNKTISRKINSLRKYITWLYRTKQIDNDFGDALEHPARVESTIRYLSLDEIGNLRNIFSKDEMMYVALEILLQTGIRLSELLKLSKDDVDLKKRILKAGNEEREIGLNTRLLFTLTHYLENLSNKKYLFETSNQTQYIPRNFRAKFDELCSEASLFITINDLRNTYIVLQLKAGVSKENLAETVGISSTRSIDRYIKLAEIDYEEDEKKSLVEI